MTNWRHGARPAGWYPRRGEVYLVELDKERPALILSSDSLNAHSLDVCVVPISTAEHKAFSLRPKLKVGDGGLERESWVKCDQPTTLEKQLVLYPPLGRLSPASMEKVEAAVKAALELA
jgi:mRNA-degrading endonuclease toxin of MazEF toxin-antitoxin module